MKPFILITTALCFAFTYSQTAIQSSVFKSLPAPINETKPNIIIVMADDLDTGQLSTYGGRNIITSHIDSLALEGMQFNHMIASEAMCVPIRASLFTGLYPMRHGSFQNHKPVYDNLKSVAHYLADLGYKVGLTGKDHSTRPVSVFPFDIVDGFEPNCVSTTDNYFLDEVKKYTTKGDKPYCLFIMSTNPHAPWTVGDPSQFDPERLELPAHWVDTKETRIEFTKYLAEVGQLDQQVGDIRAMLRETGQDKNTIVIFLGEQGSKFPGSKWTLWDNGQRSAMIVKWPEMVVPNVKTDALVQYEDIVPTLIAIAGGKPNISLDGTSFLSVLKNKDAKHREYAFGIHNNIPEGTAYPIRSIRDTHYKLIINLKPENNYYIKYTMNPDVESNPWNSWVKMASSSESAKFLTDRISKRPGYEFYDLKKDPFELENLAQNAAYKGLVDDFVLKLKDWMQEQGDEGAATDKVYKKK